MSDIDGQPEFKKAATVSASCALCRRERPLRLSHFMPAALYPAKKKQIMAGSAGQRWLDPEEIAQHLLCHECETRFNREGETEVLRWISAKAKIALQRLVDRAHSVPPDIAFDGYTLHKSKDLGIEPTSFAYFALSILWRATFEWPLQDGSQTKALALGRHTESIRTFLVGESPFPDGIVIALTICTDKKSREVWTPPNWSDVAPPGPERGLIGIPILGMLFRVWLGPEPPGPIRRTAFYPASENPVFTTSCWDELGKSLGRLFEPSNDTPTGGV